MIACEAKHREDLTARRAALFRDAPPRIELSVLGDEGLEGPDADEIPATAREALELAMAGERRARDFFAAALPHLRDPAVADFFRGLANEEVEHEALLARKLAELPPDGEPAPRPAARPCPPLVASPPEDRAALADALPRFDAATQAVARGVLLEGRSEEEVAAAIGVARGTVRRSLARFLAAARQHTAVALAAATLAGCAGNLRSGEAARGAEAPPPRPAVRAVPDRTDAERLSPTATWLERGEERTGVAARVHAHVARRMARHDAALQRRVARAIVAEARQAGLDPLLVVALIHVESSFDPLATSTAGAVGLMQLREPTMRRERVRSGLPSADPRDPVANVEAGVRYLRRLVDAFGGMDAALMAYNAGPNRIRGHLRAGEIPERFHVYPKKVKGELQRLRAASDAPQATRDRAG